MKEHWWSSSYEVEGRLQCGDERGTMWRVQGKAK